MVVAHPDDETLALGSRMSRLADLCIIHLTDGAPRDLVAARRAGLPDAASYAALRRTELRAALAALQASADLRCYDIPDQQAVLHARAIIGRLVGDLSGAAAVVTHAYEHGHPDHDTAALAVALACEALEARNLRAPAILEFPAYHLRDRQEVFGAFWPDPRAPEAVLLLDQEEIQRKRAAIACFASQAAILSRFPIGSERLRRAPPHDFRRPAPPGLAWYDKFGWDMTLAVWRRHADALLGGQAA